MDVLAVAAQRAMFQLKIDNIVVPDLAADVLNMFICEPAYAAVSAAQQVLVQIEYGYVEEVAQLSFETARVRTDAAQLVVSGDQCQSLAAAAAPMAKRRCAKRSGGKERRMSFELERCHIAELHPRGGLALI